MSGLGREVGSGWWVVCMWGAVCLFVGRSRLVSLSQGSALSLVSVPVLTAVAYGLTAHTEGRVSDGRAGVVVSVQGGAVCVGCHGKRYVRGLSAVQIASPDRGICWACTGYLICLRGCQQQQGWGLLGLCQGADEGAWEPWSVMCAPMCEPVRGGGALHALATRAAKWRDVGACTGWLWRVGAWQVSVPPC